VFIGEKTFNFSKTIDLERFASFAFFARSFNAMLLKEHFNSLRLRGRK
jgi:hypothetical protein